MAMKRILAVLFLVTGVVPLAGDSRRRAVRVPSLETLPVANFIDTQIGAKLAGNAIAPAAVAGDEEFLRRVTLDLTGVIPASADLQSFLADTRTDKRARKIDALLNSEAFTDRWTMWFGDLVQNVQFATNSREYYVGKNAYHSWIRASIQAGKPYDLMVRELLAAEGDSFVTGGANYVVRQIQRNGPPQDTLDNLAAHSAEKFLGIPMLCISCHSGGGHLELVNSWLREKKREDFWKMAAFFARTSVRGERYVDPANPNANIIKFNVGSNPNGTYLLNTTDGNKTPRAPSPGQPNFVTPAFITTGETPKPGEPYRVAYGRMLTADRQFARATANYLWKEMFGRGIVEPLNAFDLSKLNTQPSHPALLEALADELIAKNFSLRETLRTIALSNTYQLSSFYPGQHPDDAYFARRSPRRLSAEVLFDAVASATSVPAPFRVQGLDTPVLKALQLPDPLDSRRAGASVFIDNFGRGNRDDILRTNDSNISQSLSLMNDPVLTMRVKRANNSTVQKILAATSDPVAVTDQLYVATLSRHPTAQERQIAVDYLKAGTPFGDRVEDLQFVLLNSLEFLFN